MDGWTYRRYIINNIDFIRKNTILKFCAFSIATYVPIHIGSLKSLFYSDEECSVHSGKY